MNIPPVTIIQGGAAADLTGCEIRCLTCQEVIESPEPLRGYVQPHRHESDGDGCSAITIKWPSGNTSEFMVRVDGLTAEELNTEHPMGLDKIVADAAKKMAGLSSGASEEWLLLQLRPFANTVMRWEREGCAQECDAVAKSLAEGLERMGERHDCYDSTHVSKSTAEDLAESIRDRDGTEEHTDALEVAQETIERVKRVALLCRDEPGNVEECTVSLALMDESGVRKHEREDIGAMFCRILGIKREVPEGSTVIHSDTLGDIVVTPLNPKRDGDQA